MRIFDLAFFLFAHQFVINSHILVDFKIYFNRLQGYSTVNNLIFPRLFKKCCCIGQGMKNKNFTVQWLKNQPRWPHCKRAINLLILNEIGYITIANPKANHMYAMRTYFYELW
jgi:hypothetical protein